MQHRMTVNAIGRQGQEPAVGRPRPLIVALLLALMALGWSVARPTLRLPAALSTHDSLLGPVVTVAQVERALIREPNGWGGRILLVRGRATHDVTWQAPDSLAAQLALVDVGGAPGTPPLALAWGQPDPLLTALRRLPLVGSLAPRPQWPHWGAVGLYRIQLRRRPGRPDSADAVLLDADPEGH